jgi:hypothetical protein
MHNHILSIILFTPLAGALLLIFVPKEQKDAIRWIANIFALAGLLVSIPLVPWFWAQRFEPGFKFMEGAPNNWIPSIGAGYVLGIDGISFLLIMLTALLGWISILSSWEAIETRVKEYYIWFLVLQTGMLGVFMALDFFLFFVFWEAMLVPMYLLIGIWGGPRKLYAAIKFFLYTLFGSVLMLLSVLFLYFYNFHQTGQYTFSIQALYKTAPLIFHDPAYGSTFAIHLFLAFFLAFAIKVPMFPFHTWLPDAHVRRPRRIRHSGGVLLRWGPTASSALPCRSSDVVMHPKVRGWMIFLSIVGIVWGPEPDAEGHEEAGGVFVRQPPGFLHPGNLRVEPSGIERIGVAADQPRHLHRRSLLDRRHSVRAATHPRNIRIRRHLERHAGLRHHNHDHVPVLHGTASAEWIRWRVHHPAGHLHGKLEVGGMGGTGRDPGGRVSSVALPAGIFRDGHQPQE